MKRLAFVLLSISYIFLTSCGGNTDQAQVTETDGHTHVEVDGHDHTNEEGHEHGEGEDHDHGAGEHTYTCRMHPEVTSHAPGKCPKCGMDLEHTDGAVDHTVYEVAVSSSPASLQAGVAGKIIFRPTKVDDAKAKVNLELQHEKKMHVMLLSKDLSFFRHLHPNYKGDGKYELEAVPANTNLGTENSGNQVVIPAGGEYYWFVDYKPAGAAGRIDRIAMTVQGKAMPAVTYSKASMTWKGEGYEVKCSPETTPKVGGMTMLDFSITKAGKPILSLDQWLGARGHLALLPIDAEKMIHAHPADADADGSKVVFHSEFEKASVHRAFFQFKHEGKLHVADFTLVVN